jgi:hypothetical protein
MNMQLEDFEKFTATERIEHRKSIATACPALLWPGILLHRIRASA